MYVCPPLVFNRYKSEIASGNFIPLAYPHQQEKQSKVKAKSKRSRHKQTSSRYKRSRNIMIL